MLFCLFQAIFIIIVWVPNTLRPRGFRLCEPFGSYQVKIKESELKIRSHRTLNTDQILSKNHGNLMLPDQVIANSNSQKVLT